MVFLAIFHENKEGQGQWVFETVQFRSFPAEHVTVRNRYEVTSYVRDGPVPRQLRFGDRCRKEKRIIMPKIPSKTCFQGGAEGWVWMTMIKIPSRKTCYTCRHGPPKTLSRNGTVVAGTITELSGTHVLRPLSRYTGSRTQCRSKSPQF